MRFPGNPVDAMLLALPAVLAAAALAAPASAATMRIQAGGPGGGGVCNAFDVTASAALIGTANCGGPNGGANGLAAAGFGEVGVEARVVSLGPLVSLFAQASFSDTVTFFSVDPNATQADVALNLVLEGLLANEGASQPRLEGGGRFGGSMFEFVLQRSATTNTSYTGLNLVGGTLNDPNTGLTAAFLRTPFVTVTLGTPIDISFALRATTFAIGSGNFGSVAFANTFEVPIGSDAFVLPQGVTANSGTWLVNNRRVDPNAGAVPEPATWALMIGGFGMAGAMLRRRRSLTA